MSEGEGDLSPDLSKKIGKKVKVKHWETGKEMDAVIHKNEVGSATEFRLEDGTIVNTDEYFFREID